MYKSGRLNEHRVLPPMASGNGEPVVGHSNPSHCMVPPSNGENSPATRRDGHPNPYLITGPDTPPTNSLVGDSLPGRITHSPISEVSLCADQGKKRLKTGPEPRHMDTDVEYPTLEWTNPELNS